MHDLLFVAHASAFSALALGAWSRLAPQRARAAAPPPVIDEASSRRYQEIVATLADLERQKQSGQIEPDDYEARRKPLIDEALRLKGSS